MLKRNSIKLALTLFLILALSKQAHAQDKFTRTLNADERKDLQALQDDWKKQEHGHKNFITETTLTSQTILGRLGYGTRFTGVVDEQTTDAIKAYQGDREINPTGIIDAETFFSL